MKKYILISLALVLSLGFIACADEDNTQTGTLTVTMTDAPFPSDLVDSANVTINRIEIRRINTSDTEFLTLSEETIRLNLLDLQNGVKESLVNLDIEVGQYDHVRLYIVDADVILKDGQRFDLTIPSGSQSGLKIFIEPSIIVQSELNSELLIDFDVAKSFVVQGNPNSPAGINGFIFKPVLRAVNASITGTIEGMVSDTSGALLSNVHISVLQDSVISNGFSSETGNYTFIGLPEGTYSMMATATDFDTLRVPEVQVNAANSTALNLELIPSAQ